MEISLLIKRATVVILPITALMSLTTMPVMSAFSIPVSKLLESVKTPVSNPQNIPENLKSFEELCSGFAAVKSPMKESADRPMLVTVNSTVKSEIIIEEDFSKWNAGTNENPCAELVTDEQLTSLMNNTGEWTALRMYEAGGAGYMGFDEIGDEGPGYLKSPSCDFSEGGDNYYRLTCHVKNVNENAQTQGLQAFIFDESNSSTIAASAQNMEYNEWVNCEWIGASGSSMTSFMVFGWQGKVLIDGFKIERLIFPLATPRVNGAELLPDGSVKVTWEKVAGATEYTVEVLQSSNIIVSEDFGDVDSCILNFDIDGDDIYAFHVIARNGEEISYPGSKSATLSPEYVGKAIAKSATNITADGFTANWEAADFASNYLIMPTVTHTAATDGDEFYYLNEEFTNVPESADDYSPIQICPMLGYDGTDIYMSRAGWSIDMGMMWRLSPEMPALALTNLYAMYGLEGALVSPLTDYSVGNGTVKVSGMAISSLDDVIVLCGFMNTEGEIYSSDTFEVSTEGDMFEIEVVGGRSDSYFVFKINESAEEGGDMIAITSLSLSTVLNEGETVTAPAETIHAGNVTETRVDVPVNEYNKYSYCVQGYYSADLMGEVSESIEVNDPSGIQNIQAKNYGIVSANNGILTVINPAHLVCEIYTIDGKCLYTSALDKVEIQLERGMYVVKLGDKSFKVFN